MRSLILLFICFPVFSVTIRETAVTNHQFYSYVAAIPNNQHQYFMWWSRSTGLDYIDINFSRSLDGGEIFESKLKLAAAHTSVSHDKICATNSGYVHYFYVLNDVTSPLFYMRSKDFGASWSSPRAIVKDDFPYGRFEVACDESGGLVASWQNWGSNLYDMKAIASQDFGETFLPFQELSAEIGKFLDGHQICSMGDGKFLVVWYHAHSSTVALRTTQNAGKTWSPKLNFTTTKPNPVKLFCNSSTAILDWKDDLGHNIVSSQDAGISWGSQLKIPRVDSTWNRNSTLKTTMGGRNSFFVWHPYGSREVNFVSSADLGRTWTPPISLDSGMKDDNGDSHIALTTDNMLAVLWTHGYDQGQGVGAGHLYASISKDLGQSWSSVQVPVGNQELYSQTDTEIFSPGEGIVFVTSETFGGSNHLSLFRITEP